MLVAVLAGCHNSGSTTREAPASLAAHLGVYEFSDRVTASGASAESMEIRGQIVVTTDTVVVDASPGPCRYDVNTMSPNPFAYDCGINLRLTFDRRDPVSQAQYVATLAENVTQTVCVRYATDAYGRRYCAESQSQTTQRMVKRGGHLRLTRVNNP